MNIFIYLLKSIFSLLLFIKLILEISFELTVTLNSDFDVLTLDKSLCILYLL